MGRLGTRPGRPGFAATAETAAETDCVRGFGHLHKQEHDSISRFDYPKHSSHPTETQESNPQNRGVYCMCCITLLTHHHARTPRWRVMND